MNPEVETYSTYIRKQIASVHAVLAGLSDEQLNWRPPVEGANSAFVIATHVFGNARAWVLGIVCGQPVGRDRPAEFASAGSYADLGKAARELSGEIDEALAALDEGVLERRLVPSLELWGEGYPQEISVRQALVHVLEHASMHRGQIQLTRDLAIRESGS